ncbi:MAG TPA: phosphotransferase family protein [Spirochaetota bacterium]|nr:phosphotransferase family protein [Spirochaetota bacterium]
MTKIDEAKEIRNGEQLDVRKLEVFLKDSISGLDGEVTVKQFPSGFSNLTYYLKIGEREMVLRRPPFGKKAKTAHDMSREFRILSALKPVYPYCPEPYLYCEDESVIGSPFYVMQKFNGVILRRDFPKEITPDAADAEKLSRNLIGVLCELHAIDYDKIGFGNFGKPEGYVERQVKGWTQRYIDSKTDDAPDFETVMKWLVDNMPPDTGSPSIIHNDYKFDNVVLNPQNILEITGVLDWEMATIGDPLMDLGNSLAYWVNRTDTPEQQMMRQMPTNLEGMLSRKEQVALYSKLTGRPVDSFYYYYCFGLFRLAVIGQQIYYRYYHGQTSDERFKLIIYGVKALEKAALNVINTEDF